MDPADAQPVETAAQSETEATNEPTEQSPNTEQTAAPIEQSAAESLSPTEPTSLKRAAPAVSSDRSSSLGAIREVDNEESGDQPRSLRPTDDAFPSDSQRAIPPSPSNVSAIVELDPKTFPALSDLDLDGEDYCLVSDQLPVTEVVPSSAASVIESVEPAAVSVVEAVADDQVALKSEVNEKEGDAAQDGSGNDVQEIISKIPTPAQLADMEAQAEMEREQMDVVMERMPSQKTLELIQKKFSVWGNNIVRKLRRNSISDANSSLFPQMTGTSVYCFLDGTTGSLEDVLLSDDFFEEFEVPRRKLLIFLGLKQNITSLFSYVVTPSSEGSLTSKLATVSFEILQSCDPVIMQSMFSMEDFVWDSLFLFMQSPYEQEHSVLYNFSRLISKLFSVKPRDIWGHMKRSGGFKHILKHISEPYVYELVQSMLFTLHNSQTTDGMSVMEEWKKSCVVSDFISAFNGTENESSHRLICSILQEFLESNVFYFNAAAQFSSKTNFSSFLSKLSTGPDSCPKYGLPLLQLYLNKHMQSHRLSEVPNGFDLLQDFLSGISTLLDQTPNSPVRTTTGSINPALGLMRLNLLGIIESLAKFDNVSFHQKIVSTDILHKLMDMFFSFKWNNLLHNCFVRIVTNCFIYKYETLYRHFFDPDYHLLDKLLERVKAPVGSWGNIEHCNQLLGVVNSASYDFPFMANITRDHPGWAEYIDRISKREGQSAEQTNQKLTRRISFTRLIGVSRR